MKNSKLELYADNTEFLIISFPTQRRTLGGFFPTHNLSQSIIAAATVLNQGSLVTSWSNAWWKLQFQTACIEHMSLLFWQNLRSSLCSQVYLTFRSQYHCNPSSKQQTWLLQFFPLQYRKQGYSNISSRSRFSRSAPLLKSLNWLPVHYRIIFTITYQVL